MIYNQSVFYYKRTNRWEIFYVYVNNFIVLGLIVFKVFGPLWMEPMMALSYRMVNVLITPLALILR